MANLTQKVVEASIDSAIKSDQNNAETVKKALAMAILFAAGPVGRVQPLNRLVKGVTIGTREAIRNFVVNMTRAYGVRYHDEKSDKERVTGFLSYKAKDAEYSHASNVHAKEARDNIAKLDIADLMKIVLGSPERDQTDGVEKTLNADDFEKAVENLLKKFTKAGAIGAGTVGQFNKLLSAERRVNAGNIVKEAEETAAKLIKRAETLRANVDKIKAGNENETVERMAAAE